MPRPGTLAHFCAVAILACLLAVAKQVGFNYKVSSSHFRVAPSPSGRSTPNSHKRRAFPIRSPLATPIHPLIAASVLACAMRLHIPTLIAASGLACATRQSLELFSRRKRRRLRHATARHRPRCRKRPRLRHAGARHYPRWRKRLRLRHTAMPSKYESVNYLSCITNLYFSCSSIHFSRLVIHQLWKTPSYQLIHFHEIAFQDAYVVTGSLFCLAQVPLKSTLEQASTSCALTLKALHWRTCSEGGTMRSTVFGRSALSLWLTAHARPSTTELSSWEVLSDKPRESIVLPYLRERFPQIPPPVHLFALSWKRGSHPGIEVTTTQRELPRDSLCAIDHGLFAPAPELCLMQMAGSCTFLELILIGSALCSTFAIDPIQRSGLTERTPLTSKARIADYLAECPGHRGTDICRRAIPYLVEGAASPPEIFLSMALTLPGRLGGFGLPRGEANAKIFLSKRASSIAERSYVVPDLCWKRHGVAVEYDSNAEHLSPQQITMDAKKRLALEADGFSVVTITTSQLAKAQSMSLVAEELAKRMGNRRKTRSRHFSSRQSELFGLQWNLTNYINEHWLDAVRRDIR